MKTIAVWFSCGAASAVAAKKTIEKYGSTHNIRLLNNPVLRRIGIIEDFLLMLNDGSVLKSKWL